VTAARFRTFSTFTLAVTLLVIIWGAYVRASGSGAGCGSHWPTCNGAVIPRAPTAQTLVELTHRATSGLALLAILALLVLVLRRTEPGHPARRAAWLSLLFVFLEAGIGAGLVLFEWVAGDKSLARGFVMAAHLINTFLLLGALTLTAWYASGRPAAPLRRGASGALVAVAALGVFLTGASGGIAALGDTLFPAQSFAHALRQDVATTSHLFLKLRILHPVFACVTAALLLLVAQMARGRLGVALAALVVVQIGLGIADVLLLAPIPLQLAHLAVADAVWVVFVLVAATHAARTRTA
jgi:cytochrome c oxidase assembly protein subunit 15